eukprot:2358146-Prymnesium_polylepis.1
MQNSNQKHAAFKLGPDSRRHAHMQSGGGLLHAPCTIAGRHAAPAAERPRSRRCDHTHARHHSRTC